MPESSPSKNYFAPQAAAYAKFRPTYPALLFEFLSNIAPTTRLAWDCGTGNGQAACALAAHFAWVEATDVSAEQISCAEQHPRVRYHVAPAHLSGLSARSVDLVTAAAAVHWFDLDEFYAEVRRVLAPEGVVALWTYFDMQIAPEIDPVVAEFSRQFLLPYWPKGMEYPLSRYESLPFPFEPIAAPQFHCSHQWSLERLLAFVATFSGVKAYSEARGADPVVRLRDSLAPLWGSGERTICWPLALRLGKAPSL